MASQNSRWFLPTRSSDDHHNADTRSEAQKEGVRDNCAGSRMPAKEGACPKVHHRIEDPEGQVSQKWP